MCALHALWTSSFFSTGNEEQRSEMKGKNPSTKDATSHDGGDDVIYIDEDEITTKIGDLQIADLNQSAGQNVPNSDAEDGPNVAATKTVHSDSDCLVAYSTPAGNYTSEQ